jgi:glycoside/pentoside/hexuronide:cation symporter, GPH family
MGMATMDDDAGASPAFIAPAGAPTFPRLVLYGSGEAATSLVLNGLYGFALIFYTEALGLSPALAGLALSISILWEAVTEPYMGYLSDRTRSRFGTRFPWIATGVVVIAVAFYFLWAVPMQFRGGGTTTFVYLVVLNLLLRLGLTMFIVPYLALGFEVAPAYDDRPRLQGVRWVCNMAANMAGPALAWIIFFPDTKTPQGKVVTGTSVVDNFVAMGSAFSIAIVLLTALMLWGCRSTIRDTRKGEADAAAVRSVGFWEGFRPIIADVDVRCVLILIFLMVVGMVIVSSMQSYLYVHFMIFSGVEKTVVHGSTMVAAALGAAISPWAARRFDKKGAIVLGAVLGILGEVGLAALFLPGWMPRAGTVAIATFVVFQGLYWVASGVVLPVATAMIADIAELGRLRTGRTVDGSYSAIFSLAWRAGTSLSLLITGGLLSLTGFDTANGRAPTPESIWWVAALAFLVGTVFYVLTIAWVQRYTLDRARYAALTAILGE